MATNDWLGWLVPALRLFQLSWVDRKSSVLCAVPPEVTEEHISRHRSALAMAPAATLALGAPTLASFGPAPAAAVPVPKAAMLNYEGSALVEVVAGPLLDALRVDTSIPACVTVQERSGGAALCVLQTGGFDPTVVGSVASRQLADLIALVPTRTPQSIDLIQAQAATIWPFVAAACTKPFEHRLATRALLDVGAAPADCRGQASPERRTPAGRGADHRSRHARSPIGTFRTRGRCIHAGGASGAPAVRGAAARALVRGGSVDCHPP